jgi:zinc/manganese transport system ATP-binding protein
MRLACEDLTISYQRHPALHHITCELKLGVTTAIIGPNGAGKSTFLKAILGEVRPETGRVVIQGLARCDIAYLPQINTIDHNLPLTVGDVVSLGNLYKIGLFNKTSKDDDIIINDALNQVGLSGFNLRYVHELSSGQLQRVLLARVIVQQAKVIILDEPFNALDSKTIADMLSIIKSWQQDGKTVIAVLHDLTQVANNFDYTMLLAKELVAYDVTQNVLRNDTLKRAYSHNFMWLDNNDLCSINT